MAQKRYSLYYPFLMLVLLTGCIVEPPEIRNDEIGYKPVYDSEQSLEISINSARPVENPGKIYVYGKYLLVNEINKGIHVFDNTDPSNPLAIGFIQLLGNTDMAVNDGTLYADHMGNLVALTTNDFNSIEEEGRLPLRNWELGIPPPQGFYFECVDASKGIVISWTKATNKNLHCYAL